INKQHMILTWFKSRYTKQIDRAWIAGLRFRDSSHTEHFRRLVTYSDLPGRRQAIVGGKLKEAVRRFTRHRQQGIGSRERSHVIGVLVYRVGVHEVRMRNRDRIMKDRRDTQSQLSSMLQDPSGVAKIH